MSEDEIDLFDVTKTEKTNANEMMEPQKFEELVKQLNASPPRRATRVKLKLSVLLHGKGLLTRVHLVSLSSRAVGIDKKISIRYGDVCYMTLQTDPPITLKCLPIIGSVEFGLGKWDRMLVRTNSI